MVSRRVLGSRPAPAERAAKPFVPELPMTRILSLPLARLACAAVVLASPQHSVHAQAPSARLAAALPWSRTAAFPPPRPPAAVAATSNFLFYRDRDGAGALVTEMSGAVTPRHTYAPGSFSTGWTHVSPVFYNARTGAGATALLARGTFTTTTAFQPGSFSPGWTSIAQAGTGSLFYNAATGAAALGYNPTTRSYAAGSFSTGWTHVVGTAGDRLLFYNAATGAGAVARVTYRAAQPGELAVIPDQVVTLQSYPAGSFATGWTHIVDTSQGMLFYRAGTGEGGIGVVTASGFVTLRGYPAGAFSTGWTHVASGGEDILFYHAATGAGAVAVIDRSTASPTVRTLRSYPAGTFGAGWTHVAASVDPSIR
jgi:hypothetical protein